MTEFVQKEFNGVKYAIAERVWSRIGHNLMFFRRSKSNTLIRNLDNNNEWVVKIPIGKLVKLVNSDDKEKFVEKLIKNHVTLQSILPTLRP